MFLPGRSGSFLFSVSDLLSLCFIFLVSFLSVFVLFSFFFLLDLPCIFLKGFPSRVGGACRSHAPLTHSVKAQANRGTGKGRFGVAPDLPMH